MTQEFYNGLVIIMLSFAFGLLIRYFRQLNRYLICMDDRNKMSISYMKPIELELQTMRITNNNILTEVDTLRENISKMHDEFAILRAETEALRDGCGCDDDKFISSHGSIAELGSNDNTLPFNI
jgi:hypothetical protein